MASHIEERKQVALNEYYCEIDGPIYAERKQDWFICPFCIQNKLYLNETDIQLNFVPKEENQ